MVVKMVVTKVIKEIITVANKATTDTLEITNIVAVEAANSVDKINNKEILRIHPRSIKSRNLTVKTKAIIELAKVVLEEIEVVSRMITKTIKAITIMIIIKEDSKMDPVVVIKKEAKEAATVIT